MAQLAQTCHPILGVPCANYLAVFDFVDVDGLYFHRSSGGWQPCKNLALCAGYGRPDHDFVALLDDVLDLDVEIGNALVSMAIAAFAASGPCGTAGGEGMSTQFGARILSSSSTSWRAKASYHCEAICFGALAPTSCMIE
ncbi:hypothetical protein PQR36_35880 [Paraburkholderia nemoris]